MNSIHHHATGVPWQFFVTLTFKGAEPGPSQRQRMLFAFLRSVAKGRKSKKEFDSTVGRRRFGPVPFSALGFLVRSENGELTGRYHFHALLIGLPESRVNKAECFSQMKMWEELGGGFARVRVFDPSSSGVSYVLKGLEGRELVNHGANKYELSKFDDTHEDRELILSSSLVRKWASERFRKGLRWTHASATSGPCDRRPSRKGQRQEFTRSRYGVHPYAPEF